MAEREKGHQCVSDILNYIYGKPFNTARMDAFNAANLEIVKMLKGFAEQTPEQKIWSAQKREMNRIRDARMLWWKLFDYIVNRKLDNSEIQALDHELSDRLVLTNGWKNFVRSAAAPQIDAIYRKYGLDLPPFETWRSTDLNKGPNDRGELSPDAPEYDIGPDGLAKARYDAYGNKKLVHLQEVRLLIREILEKKFLCEKINLSAA